MVSRLDWVVVGGGPHGVCAARALQAAGAELRIVEPSGELLHRWSARAQAVAMTWMRSPVSHHLDAHATDLHHFLHHRDHADVAGLAGPFSRPRHAAFLRHTEHVIVRERLRDAVVTGRVESLRDDGDGLVVEGLGVELRARRVLVATGSNRPRIPAWARHLRQEGAAIDHVFDDGSAWATDIVGGGISAVQRALEVRRRTGQTVRLWARRPIVVADFDYDQAMARSRFVGRWSKFDDDRRLSVLDRQSGRGSVPPGLSTRLAKAVRRGHVQLHRGVPRVHLRQSSGRLVLAGGGVEVESDGLTLATGLEPERIGGWLQPCVERLGLPVRSELPRLQHDMHWGRGIHVCGPLARLRLGPMASNLIGARWATSLLPGVRMLPN